MNTDMAIMFFMAFMISVILVCSSMIYSSYVSSRTQIPFIMKTCELYDEYVYKNKDCVRIDEIQNKEIKINR